MTVICEISGQFGDGGWIAPSPCPEWRVIDLAGHLRCVADDFHEYLDDAPASRLARLMATGADPGTLARKLARQNAAELAALPDASGPEHIEAFASSARAYAQRLLPIWDLPHHQYRDVLVTVGGMAGAACAEWHLHAWDLARAQGKDYRPADPDMLLRGWIAGLPYLPLEGAAPPSRYETGPYQTGPYQTGPYQTGPYQTGPYQTGPYQTGPYQTASYHAGPYQAGPYGAGRCDRPVLDRAVAAEVAPARRGPAAGEDPWHVMLRASGRVSLGRMSPGPVL